MKNFMIDSTSRTLLMNELHSASSYIERILFTIKRLIHAQSRIEAYELCSDFACDLEEMLMESFLCSTLQKKLPAPSSLSLEGAQDPIDRLENIVLKGQKILEGLSYLPLNFDEYGPLLVDYINLIYHHAHGLHQFCVLEADVDIPYPRLHLVEIKEQENEADETDELDFLDEWAKEEGQAQPALFDQELDELFFNQSDPPLELRSSHDKEPFDNEGEDTGPINAQSILSFYLPLESIQKSMSLGHNLITGLEYRREKKYQDLLTQGHSAMLGKQFQEGLDRFSHAIKLKETAEALTLMAWACGLVGEVEKAKSLCLKAIQKDPDYGPAYNDLGAILLKEGQINESLKWFELAKRSPNYHNREYPYINSGRAYLGQKKYPQALEEFSRALALAPYHKELHQTVDKLRQAIEKSDMKHSQQDGAPL